MTQNLNQVKVFHIFYTKDLHKKKKTFREGVLVISVNNMAKIFDEDGLLVASFKNKQQVEVQQEYTVNNSFLVTIDRRGNTQEYKSGAIFTKKQITILPMKKKGVQGLNNNIKKNKAEDIVTLKCGLEIDKHLYQIMRPHQKQGVQFMYQCISGQKNNALSGCILADYMGLGKTLQTLVLTFSMIKQKLLKKFIIVCPLTLLDVWQKQTKKWLNQKIIPLVCFGDGSQTSNTVKKFVSYQYRMLIISYQTFYKNIQKLSGNSNLIIFDEGHRIKNKKSKLLLKLKTFKCQKRILLTGTPIQNNLQQLYTCISVINPKMFGNETLFKNVFQKPIIQGLAKKATSQQKQLANQRTIQLARQLKQFSLRRTADVLKKFLPPKNQHQIFLELTPLQKRWYQRVLQYKKQFQQDMFKTLNYLRKLFIHPSLLKIKRLDDSNAKLFFQDCSQQKSQKIQIALKILQNCLQSQQKCVVVSYFTETLDFIGKILKQRKIDYAKLDGRQKTTERKLAVAKFEKQCSILLLSGKAGGTGLTLVCAVKMIMIQPDWNPSNDSQVMGRIWRQGQQKQVNIYRFIIACTFQQKILQRQYMKKTLANNLIDKGNSQQVNSGVDFQNIGNLFIQNKRQVLTYTMKQNQLKQFRVKHQFLFENDRQEQNPNNIGIIFVKTNSTLRLAQGQKKQQQQEVVNQFTHIGIQNFIGKGSAQGSNATRGQINKKKRNDSLKSKDNQSQTEQDNQDDYYSNQSSEQELAKINQLQKIKVKRPELVEIIKKQIKNSEAQEATEQQTNVQQKYNYLNTKKNQKYDPQIIALNQSKRASQIFHLECGPKQLDSQKQQTLLSRKSNKVQTVQLKPKPNLLKKIIKK